MQAREWFNKLGWDVGAYEVMKMRAGLNCRSPYRSAMVTSTADPIEAVRLTMVDGFKTSELNQMDPIEASAIYLSRKL